MNVGGCRLTWTGKQREEKVIALFPILSQVGLRVSFIQRCCSTRLLTPSAIGSVCVCGWTMLTKMLSTIRQLTSFNNRIKRSLVMAISSRNRGKTEAWNDSQKWRHSHTTLSAVIVGAGSLLRIESINVFTYLCVYNPVLHAKDWYVKCMHCRHKAVCVTFLRDH